MRLARKARAVAAVAGIAGVLALSACTPTGPDAAPTAGSSTPAPSTPAPTSTASQEPVLVPDGSAEENLPLFAAVTASVWAGAERASGRAYIDALTAAGFDRSAMQVTNDLTTVGNGAESIQFSVRWDQECLIGQVGPATGEPVTVVVPVLAEGTCLVGRTRPIDW